MPGSRSHCKPQSRDCSLAEMHSGSRRRNLASEFPPLPSPWNRRAGHASLSPVSLALPSLLVGTQVPSPMNEDPRAPRGGSCKAMWDGGMSVTFEGSDAKFCFAPGDSHLLACWQAAGPTLVTRGSPVPSKGKQ